MTKRIQELMEQAMELVDPYAVEGDFGPRRLNAEKFAQLIIRECVFAVENHGGMGGSASSKKIKQHFGVEE
jgi:hypothetical protein